MIKDNLEIELIKLVDSFKKIIDKETYTKFYKRIREGALTRDENAESHSCCYTLPYNSKTREIFIINHKKSGLWISPGGHIDKGEVPYECAKREVSEELGMKSLLQMFPFFVSIVEINSLKYSCKTHYDIWYSFDTNGSKFILDNEEFDNCKWVSIEEAISSGEVTDISNINAYKALSKLI